MQKPVPPAATGDFFADIQKFQAHFGFDKQGPELRFLKNQLDFLTEELTESKEAFVDGDAEAFFDGILDIAVVAIGTLEFAARGRGREGWIRVMNKNFAKEIGSNPKRPDSGGVDLIKPEGWTPPILSDLVMKLQEVFNGSTEEERQRLWERPEKVPTRESVKILLEAASIMRKKSEDYANPNSSVQPADYYPNGLDDFVYMVDVLKRNRQTSILERMKAEGPEYNPHNEGLEDTLLDRINYLALGLEWLRGKTPGQDLSKDRFNRPMNRREADDKE